MRRTNCLICESNELKKVIDLGIHAFADTFIKEEDYYNSELTYPLIIDLCLNCGQIQSRSVTNPLDRYSLNDYSYTSSNSKFSRKHWEDYAKEMVRRFPNYKKTDCFLEIGSNDGYLLKQFIDMGYDNVCGVDPSNRMVKLAKTIGVDTFEDLFPFTNEEYRLTCLARKKKLIIANNVFNHSNCPLGFVKSVGEILEDDGVFVFELPYWLEGFRTFKYEQAYMEHESYFTVVSSVNLLARCNMYVEDIEVVDYHGGSLRVFAKKNDGTKKHCQKIEEMIHKEVMSGLFEERSYSFFMNHIKNQKNNLLRKIIELKSQGNSIIAVGSCAKGNTFLTFNGLDKKLIDCVTDSSPEKQGKYTPLTRIPIVSDDILSKYDNPYVLILAWNLSHILKPILLKINSKIKFIKPNGEIEND